MRNKFMRLALMPVMALAIGLTACENGGDPTAQLTAPQAGPQEDLISITFGNGYTVVRETDLTVGAVTATVGSAGGTVILGKHALIVPSGAVSGPTVFTMVKALPDQLRFSLTATSVGSLVANDVGAAGFSKPVKLAVSYSDAANASDPSKLRVMWAKLNGSVESQPTSIDSWKQWAIGDLTHFSDYILAIP